MNKILQTLPNRPPWAVVLLLLLSLSSCRDEATNKLLADNMVRMDRSNSEVALQCERMESIIGQRLLVNADYGDTIATLDSMLQNLYKSADSLLNDIHNSKTNLSRIDSRQVYSRYIAFRQTIRKFSDQQLKYVVEQVSADSFMNLDSVTFAKNYTKAQDSLAKLNRLTLLETDFLQVYKTFLSKTLDNINPSYCDYGDLMPMVFSEKPVYKRGEMLRTSVLMMRRERVAREATFDGAKMKSLGGGAFEYSRKVTELPGLYTRQVIIESRASGEPQHYVGQVSYYVK